MKLYAQHGYAKKDKIDRAFEYGLLDGVIFSPNNERPESLRESVYKFSEFDSSPDLLIDPQLYVSLINNAKEGNLPLYEEYYVSDLTIRDFTPRRIREVVKNTMTFQFALPVSRILSPTIILDSFTNRSAQVAHFLAEESMEYYNGLVKPPPLLLSYVFNETALSSHDEVREFLDTVSLYSTNGFYLVVARPIGPYQQTFAWERMTEWMQILYSLGVRSRFEVVCGYTDFLAFPASAAGSTAAGTGWFNSLRQFDVKRFQPSSGGRPPKDRYSSAPLLNSIFLQELVNCFDAGMVEDVLTGTQFDLGFRKGRPSSEEWPPSTSALHHWSTLRRLLSLTEDSSPKKRFDALEEAVGKARSLYSDLKRSGIQFDPTTGPAHLSEWSQSIATFRALARI
jgi:hypothetical protein